MTDAGASLEFDRATVEAEPDVNAHQPDAFTRRQVETMAGYGVPEIGIAKVLQIDPKTLRRHYRDELDVGQVKATAKVAESLFRKAMGEGSQSVTACIFWLKTRGGWREAPQTHEVAVRDFSHLTDEELEQRIVTVRALLTEMGQTNDTAEMP